MEEAKKMSSVPTPGGNNVRRRGMMPLIKNELIKVAGQNALRVIGILLIAFCFILPLLMSGVRGIVNSLNREDPGDDLESAALYAKNNQYAPEAYFSGRYQARTFLADLNAEPGSVIYRFYISRLTDAYITRNETEVLRSGKETYAKMFEEGWYVEYVNNLYIEMYGVPEEFSSDSDKPNYDILNLEKYITGEVITEMLNRVSGELHELENEIRSFDISDYYKKLLSAAEAEIKLTEEAVKEAEALLKKEPSNKEALLIKENSRILTDAYAYYTDALKYLTDKGVKDNGWEFNTVSMMSSVLRSAGALQPVDQDTFESSELSERYKNYKDYCRQLENEKKSVFSALKTGVFSLKHNAPLQSAFAESQRTAFQFELNLAAQIISVIMILLGALTLTSEYSSGTARLLLIRPRSRSKILGAKLISLAIIWGALLLASYIVLLIMNSVLGIGTDMFRADVYLLFGKEIKVGFLFSSLFVLLLRSFSLLPFIAIAVILGILTMKAPGAIIIPIALNLFVGRNAQAICQLLNSMGFGFARFLPFAYMDLTSYLSIPAETYFNTVYTGDTSFTYLLKLFISNGAGTIISVGDFLPWLGAFYIAVFSAALIFLCFPIFKKQQIKS